MKLPGQRRSSKSEETALRYPESASPSADGLAPISGGLSNPGAPINYAHIMHLQKTQGNRATAQFMIARQQQGNSKPALQAKRLPNDDIRSSHAPSGAIQRKVMVDDENEADINDVLEYMDKHRITGMSEEELQAELDTENENEDEEISIAEFIDRIELGDSSMDTDDDEWDPAAEANEPLLPEDVDSSAVRKGLSFNAAAKGYMKIDTPKNMNGEYVCHICNKTIKKGQKIDMDHSPPWKERLAVYLKAKQLTEDDIDELDGPDMNYLYNMRGSVFAHSSCNRGHAGEQNYKDIWGTSKNWYEQNGGLF